MLTRIWEYIREDLDKTLSGKSGSFYRRGSFVIFFAFFSPFIFAGLIIFLILTNRDANVKPIKKYFNQNEIEITSNLPLTSFQVDWNIEYVSQITVFKNGKLINPNFHELENNYLSIYHENTLIGRVMHFKTTKIDRHEYLFNINKMDSCYNLDLQVKGTSDSIKWIYKRCSDY